MKVIVVGMVAVAFALDVASLKVSLVSLTAKTSVGNGEPFDICIAVPAIPANVEDGV